MTRSHRQAVTDERAQPEASGRGDAAIFALASTNLVLLALQFALAGFGAFAMDIKPTDNAYAAHTVLGLAIALLTLLILAVTLASRPARTHRRTLRLAVALAVLAVLGQPLLGEGGKHVAAVGALHALNGAVILALAIWLTIDTSRRRAAGQQAWTETTGPAARGTGPRAEQR